MSDTLAPAEPAPPPIVPFWHRLPFFLGFPLRRGPLVLLVCLCAVAVLAGWVLGAFGLVFKGFLVYLGLRYGFNVLELFAKGRFEGESPDHTLWGPEKRPAKFGLVLLLYLVIASVLGSWLVDRRIERDPQAQAALIERHRAQVAAERVERQRDAEVMNRRLGLPPTAASAAAGANAETAAPAEAVEAVEAAAPAEAHDDAATPAEASGPAESAAAAASATTAQVDPLQAEFGLGRAEILEQQRPEPGERLWLRLLPLWYWPVMAALSLMLPAALIVIALEDAFFRALNPANLLFFLQKMGRAYLVLWLFFLLIAGSRQAVLSVGAGWPAALRFPLELGLATYLGLVLCALTGYALYQYHREINMEVEVDVATHHRAGGATAIARAGNTHAALRKAEPADPFERRLQGLIAEGRIADAIGALRDEMRYARLDPGLNTRLHQLYQQQGDTAAVLAHGPQWLAALGQAGQGREALAALKALRALDPAFELTDGHAALHCASAASRQGDHALAVQLLKGFDKRFPGHPETPAAFFLGARLMSEHARQHDRAAALLRAILARWPEHAAAAEVQTYLTVLEKSLARPG